MGQLRSNKYHLFEFRLLSFSLSSQSSRISLRLFHDPELVGIRFSMIHCKPLKWEKYRHVYIYNVYIYTYMCVNIYIHISVYSCHLCFRVRLCPLCFRWFWKICFPFLNDIKVDGRGFFSVCFLGWLVHSTSFQPSMRCPGMCESLENKDHIPGLHCRAHVFLSCFFSCMQGLVFMQQRWRGPRCVHRQRSRASILLVRSKVEVMRSQSQQSRWLLTFQIM